MIERLQELAAIAPDIVGRKFGRYQIGEYQFGFDPDGSIYARLSSVTSGSFVYGRPALAWLRDALEAAIEARGWDWDAARLKNRNNEYVAAIMVDGSEGSIYQAGWQDGQYQSTAEALLSALCAALKERER